MCLSPKALTNFGWSESTEVGNQNEPQNTNVNEDDSLVELMELLEEIDENKAAAKLNEISIIDSKGGRIYF